MKRDHRDVFRGFAREGFCQSSRAGRHWVPTEHRPVEHRPKDRKKGSGSSKP